MKAVTQNKFKAKIKSGEWEAISNVSRAGYVEIKDWKTKKRFTVQIVSNVRDRLTIPVFTEA